MDRKKFAYGLAGLAKGLQGRLDEQTIEVYFMALEDLDDASFERACGRALRELKFFPRPAELRALAGEHTAGERAIAAWMELKRATASVGHRASVTFEDVAINGAVRSMGGWERLCGANAEDLERFERPRFIAAYNAFARSIPADFAAHLPGLEERAGSTAKPRLIKATTPLPGGGPKVLAAPAQLALLTGGAR